MLAKINIPNAFAPQNLLLLKDDVEKAKTIALNTSSQGIIANLYAMMHRPDFSDHLSKTTIPFLLIAGKYDQYIPFDTMIPRIRLPEKTTLCILENSGHMGFVEEKEKTQDCLQQFANSCYPIK
jgi:pimeloyl-ACP methyl ester carboxylesterase